MKPEFGLERSIVAIAGPNGAGKSTFFGTFIRPSKLPFINADLLAKEQGLEPYAAAELASQLREKMIEQSKSFAFETVLSDPHGEKVEFLLRAAREQGYEVILCFVGLDSAATSESRVALRVSHGGHDVPSEKLFARYSRTMLNLQRALAVLPCVYVYDNTVYNQSFRFLAEYKDGVAIRTGDGPPPAWFAAVAGGH